MREVRTDCIHYVGDRPCSPHKREGVVCETCPHYRPGGERLLLVKLDAIGDVLRTTCLLEPLREAWTRPGPGETLLTPRITWVTRDASVDLLANNPYVERVVPYGPEANLLVQVEPFDLIAGLDAAPDAARLASLALRCSREMGADPSVAGFLHSSGAVVPAGEAARPWWQMGLWDDLKRANDRTYQACMMELLGLEGEPGRYVLELTDGERTDGLAALRAAGLEGDRGYLALNVGGGGRWEYKRWTEAHLSEFMRLASRRFGLPIGLLAGEAEIPLVERLLDGAPEGTFFTGVHPLRRFAAMVAASRVTVTGDTLAMHVALATGRPAVILFGPTSSAEIETFGLAEKIAPRMECLCCYLPRCDKSPYCQELIEPEQVADAVARVIAGG